MKHIDDSDIGNCYGCGACENVCHYNAINYSLVDGFRYPKVDETRCVGCGLCLKVCSKGDVDSYNGIYPVACFVGKTNSVKDYNNCSSGGAFRCIVKAWLETNIDRNVDKDSDRLGHSYVCGCTMNKDFLVFHKVVRINSVDDIEEFTHSKYVQSDIKFCYREIYDLLRKGNRVLFSGTPCQVDALKKYLFTLHMSSENLFLVDLVCGGTSIATSFYTDDKRG